MTKPIYLDNNATTRVDPRVVAEMVPMFTEYFGNPSSIHHFADGVAAKVATARKSVQALVGAEHDSEIIFTSGGTESNSTAIYSAIRAVPERMEIITSTVEHPAILRVFEHLEKTEGYKAHYIPVDAKGRLDRDAYRAALSENVALVSIMWANNETGTIFPVKDLAEEAKAVGAAFHTDAVQAAGKIPLEIAGSKIDMLSLSSHKLHGPKGIGALFVKRGLRFKPLIRGGHQERGRRAGTENTPGVVGLGVAAQIALSEMAHDIVQMSRLRDRLEQGILQRISNAIVTGDTENRLPNTSTIAFEFIEGEAILLHLSRAGIAASSGSACTSGSLEPSHVMRAMGVPFTAAHGATRFTLSRETTDADIDGVLEVIPGIVERLRAMSPYWTNQGAQPAGFQPAYA